jgi:hypothetical protein
MFFAANFWIFWEQNKTGVDVGYCEKIYNFRGQRYNHLFPEFWYFSPKIAFFYKTDVMIPMFPLFSSVLSHKRQFFSAENIF